MKVFGINAHESSFKQLATDASGKQFSLNEISINLPGSDKSLKITECIRADGIHSYYYPEVIHKKRIVLHFSEGYLKYDIAQNTCTRNNISVPFIIARDGTVYQLWDPQYWGYHIGGGSIGGNDEISSTSIAIELSNIGPLTLNGNDLLTINNSIYCSLNDTAFFKLLPVAYRGYEYYAKFTDVQYESLILLLTYLTERFKIPRILLSEDKRYNMFVTDIAAQASTGILSHVNFRPAGEKVDIGPAFQWNKIIASLIPTKGGT